MAEFKGFIGGPSGSPVPRWSGNTFDSGVFALSGERIAEAYLCFLRCDQNRSAVLFNIALCFFLAGSFEKALPCLDRALRALPALPPKTTAVPEELERFEAQHDGYKAAMLMDAPDLYPDRCRVSILRLKADTLYAMGNIQELDKLLPALSGRSYHNIELIKNQINKEE